MSRDAAGPDYLITSQRSISTALCLSPCSDRHLSLPLLAVLSVLQMAAYFGHSVAATDVNNDGLVDLLVGAPLFMDRVSNGKLREMGQVSVYLGRGGFSFHSPQMLTGSDVYARYGSAIAALGDLDMDGYNDVAISAPYGGVDHSGLVYIHNGRPQGPDPSPSQVLQGRWASSYMPPSFGYSMTGNTDIDQNGYPDLIVGVFGADKAVLYRARPVISVNATLDITPQIINPEEKTCTHPKTSTYVSCFKVKYCLKASGRGAPPTLNFRVELLLDRLKQKEATKRVLFLHGQTFSYSKNMVVSNGRGPACEEQHVYLRDEFRDKITPISVAMEYRLDYQLAADRTGLLPIIDVSVPSNVTKQAHILLDCGDDNICKPDLKLSVESDRQQIYIGDDNALTLKISAENQGEGAYEAELHIYLPQQADFTGVGRGEQTVLRLQDENQTKMVCDLGNPMKGGTKVLAELQFSVHQLSEEDTSVKFDLQIVSTAPPVAAHIQHSAPCGCSHTSQRPPVAAHIQHSAPPVAAHIQHSAPPVAAHIQHSAPLWLLTYSTAPPLWLLTYSTAPPVAAHIQHSSPCGCSHTSQRPLWLLTYSTAPPVAAHIQHSSPLWLLTYSTAPPVAAHIQHSSPCGCSHTAQRPLWLLTYSTAPPVAAHIASAPLWLLTYSTAPPVAAHIQHSAPCGCSHTAQRPLWLLTYSTAPPVAAHIQHSAPCGCSHVSPCFSSNQFNNTSPRVSSVTKLAVLARVSIRGTSSPGQVLLPIANWKPKVPPQVGDDIGPQIVHIYELLNSGPSTFSKASLEVKWPYQFKNGSLLYITSYETEGPINCTTDTEINPLNISNPLSSAKNNTIPPRERETEGRNRNHVRQRRDLECQVGRLERRKNAILFIYSRLAVDNFLRTENQNRSYVVRSTATFNVIEMPYKNLVSELPSNSTTASVSVVWVARSLVLRAGWVGLWLCWQDCCCWRCSFFIMYKLGFFKRVRPPQDDCTEKEQLQPEENGNADA
ncbi:Integrin alpha-V [Collichthys lucidus]|uniref:Integrin alpha-V n=1 Tax=Collichthys lucidus TaxID=240159 RepID=A0A4U5TYF8_COLLU|nr:Integrin alpha-V [Collichthys lucidus]